MGSATATPTSLPRRFDAVVQTTRSHKTAAKLGWTKRCCSQPYIRLLRVLVGCILDTRAHSSSDCQTGPRRASETHICPLKVCADSVCRCWGLDGSSRLSLFTTSASSSRQESNYCAVIAYSFLGCSKRQPTVESRLSVRDKAEVRVVPGRSVGPCGSLSILRGRLKRR